LELTNCCDNMSWYFLFVSVSTYGVNEPALLRHTDAQGVTPHAAELDIESI
jgi:hypothetical protein